MTFISKGRGDPVVFVHGALTDARMWERHLDIVAGARFRAIAVTLSHHGTAPWTDDLRAYGLPTHVAELIDFVERLAAGPVHLVGWSYGADAAISVAVERPDLVRSLFAFEPGAAMWVADDARRAEVQHDAAAWFGPVFEAARQGDVPRAVERLLDGSAGETGAARRLAEPMAGIVRDNARTLPRLLQQQAPAPVLPERLRRLPVRTCIARGGRTRRCFQLVAEGAGALLPGPHLVVPRANHLWPDADPTAFCAAWQAFAGSSAVSRG